MTAIQYFHIAFESWAALVCVIAAICVYATRVFEPKASWTFIGMLVTDAVLNVADILTYYFQGQETSAAGVMIRISYFSVYVCGFVLAAFAAAHVERVVVVRGGSRDVWLTRATMAFAVIGILTLIVFRIAGLGYDFDEHNMYYRTSACGVLLLLEGLAFLPVLIRVLKSRKVFRKPEFVGFLCFSTLPLLGLIAQSLVQGISMFNLCNSLALIVLVLTHELVYTSDNVARERRRANERIRLYHSQIQPHFIYNSLTAIRSSLDNPKEAEDLLNHFAGFLRGSMDVLTETECIPAEKEFETVKDYLFVEKTRFGDKLNVAFELEDMDYLLPAFTVQTIVENAVRHGVRKTPEGRGTVSVRSFATKKAHCIEVEDDGAGFEPKVLQSVLAGDPASEVSPLVDEEEYRSGIPTDAKASAHVGLSNVRKRLALMCGGTMDIKSAPGEGALVKISIPKEEKTKR